MRWLLSMLFLLAPLTAARAEQVVLGLSHSNVQITTSFKGSDILVFGAVKREEPIPQGAPLQVVVTVEGPSERLTVYRKDRVAGVWVNTDAVEVDSAPSFYAVSTSGPLEEVISATEDLRHHISVPQAIRSVGATVQDPRAFTEALIRIRREKGLYSRNEGGVLIEEATLFSTSIRLPASLTEGTYKTRIFLTRDRQVLSRIEGTIEVSKVGLERWLFNLSTMQPLWYGLMSLAIAVVAGWGASTVTRLLKNG